MRKVLSLTVVILVLSLFIFSLSFADYANYAAPQLEWISNAFPGLWNKPKTDILQMMAMFPDFICTDYGDQIGCVSKYNTNTNDNIFISYFTDDYEEHHDNLWKVSVTADLQKAGQQQDLIHLLWLDGMKPFHTDEDDFSFEGAVPLYFDNEKTAMVVYVQPFEIENWPFLLVEYYNGYMR